MIRWKCKKWNANEKLIHQERCEYCGWCSWNLCVVCCKLQKFKIINSLENETKEIVSLLKKEEKIIRKMIEIQKKEIENTYLPQSEEIISFEKTNFKNFFEKLDEILKQSKYNNKQKR